MPRDTAPQTRPAHHLSFEEACGIVLGSARDHASNADAALAQLDAPEQVKTGLRPVTHEDPAGFWCGRFNRDGTPRADYGTVYAFKSADQRLTRYFFDRQEDEFARSCIAPEGDWLEVQGRLFRIVGVGQ